MTIGKGCKNIYPEVNVKFCIWHFLGAFEINKNKIFLNDIKQNDLICILYKTLSNLYISEPDYVILVFELIYKKN